MAERNAWWSDASGIPPGAGVGSIDGKLAAPDFTFPGLQCLRALWDGNGADADRVREGIAEMRASLPRKGLPVVVIHGADDGLIPQAFTSAPYVARAGKAGRDVRYWQVKNAQHFDTFLGLPDYAARYVPLLAYVYAALDRVSAHLDGAALLEDATIEAVPCRAAPAKRSRWRISPFRVEPCRAEQAPRYKNSRSGIVQAFGLFHSGASRMQRWAKSRARNSASSTASCCSTNRMG